MFKALIGMTCVVTIAAGGLYIGNDIAARERSAAIHKSTVALIKALDGAPAERTQTEISTSNNLRDAW